MHSAFVLLLFGSSSAWLLPLNWGSWLSDGSSKVVIASDIQKNDNHYDPDQKLDTKFQFLNQHSPENNFDAKPTDGDKQLTIDDFDYHPNFGLFEVCPYGKISRDVFDLWIKEQYEISFNKILSNTGDLNWSKELVLNKNVFLGAVIASPSTYMPDYFYQWIRDGAITINSVVNHLANFDSFQNESLQITVENYLINSYKLQRLDNPSGKFDKDNLESLGEPKFMVNSTPFNDNWGRPQNDGPPLRIIAIENFMKNLNKFEKGLIQTENFESLKDIYFKIVKLDLKFITKRWNSTSFDLWEEVDSYHFFTSLAQLKALKVGIKLYDLYDKKDECFKELLIQTYKNLLQFIYTESGFVDYNLNRIVETPSILDKRSGLDAAIIIGSLLTHDDYEDQIPFDVTDGFIVNSLSGLVESMGSLYPINHAKLSFNLGVALGRYPEDVYDGTGTSEGNPWFLTTLSASEMLYKFLDHLYQFEQDLTIDSTNDSFFYNHIIKVNNKSSDSGKTVLNIPFNSRAFNQTAIKLFNIADSFLDVVREHVSNDGSMSEQINKYTGYMQGASDLTWSHGAFWNAYRWRLKVADVFGTGEE